MENFANIYVPWNGWTVTRYLGGGSFGKVYEIQRNILGSTESSAMKIINVPNNENDIVELLNSGYDAETIKKRLLGDLNDIADEYKIMSKLKGCANIIYCDDIFYSHTADGIGYCLYIKMELLYPLNEGASGNVTDKYVIKLGTDICRALSACRKNNIIHRDIKPSNILVSSDGNFKLGDFGVSKVAEKTAGGTKTGTYGFMAPEVYNNRPYGSTVDIYSLGMVLYWMLNRRIGPFLPYPPELPSARQIDEASQRRFMGEQLPAPANGSKALVDVILKACSYEPYNRYQTPEEFAAALSSAENGSAGVIDTDLHYTERVSRPAEPVENEYNPADKRAAVNSINPEKNSVSSVNGNIPQVRSYKGFIAGAAAVAAAVAITVTVMSRTGHGGDQLPAAVTSEQPTLTIAADEIIPHAETEKVSKAETTAKKLTTKARTTARTQKTTQTTTTKAVTTTRATTTRATTTRSDSDEHEFVNIAAAYASSTHESEKIKGKLYDYSPKMMIDNDFSTCWCEGREDDGIGETLTLYFDGLEIVHNIYIGNGLLSSKISYEINNRIKECKISFDGSDTYYLAKFEDNYDKQPYRFHLPEMILAEYMEIEIISVYKGTEYRDTCVSEIFID